MSQTREKLNEYQRQWRANLPIEKRRSMWRKNYDSWKNWVKNNLERRREIARLSYHKNKNK